MYNDVAFFMAAIQYCKQSSSILDSRRLVPMVKTITTDARIDNTHNYAVYCVVNSIESITVL